MWAAVQYSTTLIIGASRNQKHCKCVNDQLFFAIDDSAHCPVCTGVSQFMSSNSRISSAQAAVGKHSKIENNRSADSTNKRSSKHIARKNLKRRLSGALSDQDDNVLRDITNHSLRSPLCLVARPNDTELRTVTQPNNMLSNFVVSYFFKLMAIQFKNILYEEFLFDFVKREGNWRRFVDSHRDRTQYSTFFSNLSDHKLICIIPICAHAHWTIIIRRFIGNSWKIFFIDSISHGSDRRFQEWKALFFVDVLFTGEWIKVKIFQQTELECGARVCVHGVCFALSQKKSSDIIGDLSRFKDLSIRSRLMVSRICSDGFWSSQKWLHRTIGSNDMESD